MVLPATKGRLVMSSRLGIALVVTLACFEALSLCATGCEVAAPADLCPALDLPPSDALTAAPSCVACSYTETKNGCTPSRCEQRTDGRLCCVQ